MATGTMNRLSSLPVTLHVGDREIDHEEFQISPRGMVFHSNTSLAKWSEVRVTLHLPAGGRRTTEEIDCNGVVIDCRRQRSGGFKCAVLFLDLSKKSETRLTQIVQSPMEDTHWIGAPDDVPESELATF
jgi:hypothetical protein